MVEERRGRGARGRRDRLLEPGDLRLVMLELLRTRARYGYDFIKAIAELAGGEYSPSAGVIYPTLSSLQQTGHATLAQDSGGKKLYAITPQGTAFLESQRDALLRAHARLASAALVADARHAPQLQRSMQNFNTALHLRLSRGPLQPEDLRRLAEAIDRAAIDIERS
ncbi:MAG TPA: PadR family transcriptional regulator [Steroidobacteraceae bacterium]|nr:PadR family transcriptional regulator [Steroidobacteraceae bacterium]